MTIVLKNKQEIKIDGYLHSALSFIDNGKRVLYYTLGEKDPEYIETKDISSIY